MHLDPQDRDNIVCGFSTRELITFAWVILLSWWAGMVNYMNRLTARKVAFSFLGLVTELLTCSFVGWVTFLSATKVGLGDNETAVMVAIAAHMGTRALAKLQFYRGDPDRKFNEPD